MLYCDKTSKWTDMTALTLPEGVRFDHVGDPYLGDKSYLAEDDDEAVIFHDEAVCRAAVKAGLVMPPDSFYAGREGLKMTDTQEPFVYSDENGVFAVGLADGRTWFDRETNERAYVNERLGGAYEYDVDLRGVNGVFVSKGKTYLPDPRERDLRDICEAAEHLWAAVRKRRAKKASNDNTVWRDGDAYVTPVVRGGRLVECSDGDDYVTLR